MKATTFRACVLALVFAACALVAVPAPAVAQEAARLERAKSRLTPAAARELEQIVAAARARGLPTEPLVNKALEGLAKGVAPNRIMGAVRSLLDQLTQAQTILSAGSRPAPGDIEVVANALRRGVSADAARKLVAGARPGEPVAQAIHTLADLVERGVPVNAAMDLLSAWRSRGGRPEDLDRLPVAVERLVREGVSPGAAAREVASVVRASQGPMARALLSEARQASDGRGVGAGGLPAPPEGRGARGAGRER